MEPVSEAIGAVSVGFEPSRLGGPSWVWRDEVMGAILDLQETENADRPDFRPGISREMVEQAICQLLGLYESRSSDFATAYGWMGLWKILGIDFDASKLVFKPSDSDGSPEAGDASGATPADPPGTVSNPPHSPGDKF